MSSRKNKEAVSAASILRSTLEGLGLYAGLSRRRVVQEWPKIVEPTVARHAKAEKITGSTLHVIVDSAVWMMELAAMKTLLLKKVNSHIAPGVAPLTDIRFVQRSRLDDDLPQRKAENVQPLELTEADIEIVEQVLEPIKNDQVRAVLKRILEKDRILKKRVDRPASDQ